MSQSSSVPENFVTSLAQELLLVDSFLRDGGGHCFAYDKAVLEEAARRGLKCRVIGSQGVNEDTRSALHILPLLPGQPKSRPRRGFLSKLCKGLTTSFDLISLNALVYLRLRRMRTSIHAGTVIFAPNCVLPDVIGFLAWHYLHLRAKETEIVLLFRFSFLNRQGGPLGWSSVLLTACFRLLEMSPKYRRQVRLTTDSVGLKRELSLLTRLPIEVLPIPHTYRSSISSGKRIPGIQTSKGLRLVTVGRGSSDQGIAVLVDALLHLRRELACSELSAIVQAYPALDDTPALDAWRRLNEAGLPNVVLIPGAMAPDDYWSVLNAADIVVLPYSADVYHSRTSGVFVEAVACGKPVITSKGTWMADYLSDGAGRLFKSGDCVDLADVIRAAVEGIQLLRGKSAELQERILGLHNAETFLDLLLSHNRAGGECGAERRVAETVDVPGL